MELTQFFNAVILGIVEGLTEFLPVSSTGHLILVGDLLGFKGSLAGVFEVVIQLGSILAVCWVYRQKLWDVVRTLPGNPSSQHFATNLLIAFIPSAVIGWLGHDFIKTYLFSPMVVALMLVLGGVAILLIEWIKPNPRYEDVDRFPHRLAFLIGCCQVLAMIPGVSRSGATIMGALMLRSGRKAAAEFSFFLAIPTMFAASGYDLLKSYHELSRDSLGIILVGFVVAFFSALLVVRWFIQFVGKHGFAPFAWYRIAIGLVMLLILI